jgi:hypothetical protein
MSLISDMWIFYGKTDDETLMDAAYRWFGDAGYSTGGINQRWAEYLTFLGFTQPYPECYRMYLTDKTGLTSYQEAENKFFLPLQIVVGDSVAGAESRTVNLP